MNKIRDKDIDKLGKCYQIKFRENTIVEVGDTKDINICDISFDETNSDLCFDLRRYLTDIQWMITELEIIQLCIGYVRFKITYELMIPKLKCCTKKSFIRDFCGEFSIKWSNEKKELGNFSSAQLCKNIRELLDEQKQKEEEKQKRKQKQEEEEEQKRKQEEQKRKQKELEENKKIREEKQKLAEERKRKKEQREKEIADYEASLSPEQREEIDRLVAEKLRLSEERKQKKEEKRRLKMEQEEQKQIKKEVKKRFRSAFF